MIPIPNRQLDQLLWWITKVTPPLFVAAFALDARQMGNRRYERLFTVLLLVVIVDGTVSTYAMLHGWKGTPV